NNLRRVVFFLLATNLGEILTLAAALVIGLDLPLTAVMVLWVKHNTARIFISDDLKHWEMASDFESPGFFECPDLFELPVEGQTDSTKWIIHDASFRYCIGDFDGRRFVAETELIQGEFGSNFYAAQTWNNLPGRRVQIGWMRGGVYPEMPFNQQLSFPCTLTLRNTVDGLRIHRMPVAGISSLYEEKAFEGSITLNKDPRKITEGSLFDIRLETQWQADMDFCVRCYGKEIRYSAVSEQLTCMNSTATVKARDGLVDLRILVDHTSIEVFANGGLVVMSFCFIPETETTPLELCSENGSLDVRSLSVFKLRSIHKHPTRSQ
ncbi:MAG TPA: GH32 C-terminal domain-containing protein, partial [bacterium]|nr:GH32 C-terminal domain-containing protein [bacterium]